MIEKESQEELQIGYAPVPTAVIIARVLSRYHGLSPGARFRKAANTFFVSGKRFRCCLMRPIKGKERSVPGKIVVKRVGDMNIPYAQMHWHKSEFYQDAVDH